MQAPSLQLSEVTYNAADQTFESLVTVGDGETKRKYACSIDAPISMSFEDAASGLGVQALRRHEGRGGMFSEVSNHVPAQRAGRRSFDALSWLEQIVQLPGRRAA